MPLLTTSDTHLRGHTWTKRPEISGDADFAVAQVMHAARDRGADLLLAGDIVHSPRPDNSAVRFVQGLVYDFINQGRQVLYVLGNHDPVSWIDTSPPLQDAVLHLSEGSYRLGDHKVVGVDYCRKAAFLDALANLEPDASVLVCHQRFREAFGWDTYHATMADVPDYIRLVLVGDIHTPHDKDSGDGRRLIYPGAPYMTRLDDDQDPRVVLVHDDLSVEWIPLQARPVVRAVVRKPEDKDSVVSRARHERQQARESLPDGWNERVDRPIVVVRFYVDEVPGAAEDLSSALEGEAHVFGQAISRESERAMERVGDISRPEDLNDLTLRAFLEQEVDREESPVVFGGLEEVLSGVEISEVIRHVGVECGLAPGEVEAVVPRRG